MIAEVDREAQPVAEEVRAMQAMMTADEARAAAGRIRLSVGDLRRLLLDFEERRGYRALGYQNMRLCAEHEFGWPKSQFYRQLKAIDVERSVGVAIGDMPESHARELARLPAGERREAYAAAGDTPIAADVRAEVERRLPREDRLPDTEPPDYTEDTAPVERRAMPRAEPPEVTVSTPGAAFRHTLEYRGLEAAAVAVTETVGSSPAPESRVAANGEAGAASSASRHSQDPPAPQSAVGIEDDEEWLVGLLERRWLLENGLPTPKLVRLARIVTARAGDSTRAGMAARAMLAEAKE